VLYLKNTRLIFFLILCYWNSVKAQDIHGHENVRWSTQTHVLDSTEGILIYNKMMTVLKTEYAILKQSGYEVKGWNEEYYDSGQLLHISYYRDRRLVLFKNFYENGQCEHNVAYTDSLNCTIDVYFENGSLKNQIAFFSGMPKKLADFFPNGLPKNNIEYDRDQQSVFAKKNWFVNAETQSELIMLDKEGKKYSEKTFYPNGQIKEEGELVYNRNSREYLKTGTWTRYESNGKKKHSEKFKVKLASN